jgi:uncharacterized protein VirK/YbjX
MTRLLKLFVDSTVQNVTISEYKTSAPSQHPVGSLTHVLNSSLPVALILSARHVHPEQSLPERLDRLKYIFRGLCAPLQTSGWFRILKTPQLGEMLQRNPHMLSKLQRPYLHVKLSGHDKIAALKFHYDYLLTCMSADMIAAIAEPSGVVVSQLDFAEDGKFSLRFYYDTRFEKEGELCLGLFDDIASEFLFTITFCIVQDKVSGEPTLFVGGLQGHKFDNQRERIVTLTRNMHGLRPKALLVFAVQRLAQMWGLKSIIGVGDSQHIYRKFGRRKEFNACYDAFWEECDGVRNFVGNYVIPAEPQTRSISELPSGKRSLYRKRYAMLAEMGLGIQRAVMPVVQAHEAKVAAPFPIRLVAQPVHF